MRSLTLKQRLLFTGVILAIAPLLAIGVVCWQQFQAISHTAVEGSRKMAASNLAQAGETAYTSVKSAEGDVVQSLHAARAALDSAGGLQFPRHRKTSWMATNQETRAQVKVSLPAVTIGTSPDRRHRATAAARKLLVDEVRDLTGATCTVFQRMNRDGDMLRISTSVLGPDGKRATGTFIPARSADGQANRVLAAVLAGKQYLGKALVVGSPYMTAYEPITASDGSVIGMLYTGVPEPLEAARLRERLSGMQVAQRGEVFALSPAGSYVFSTHEAAKAVVDQAARKEMVSLSTTHPDAPQTHHFRAGDGTAMIAHLRYFPSWNWLIGVAIPERDFLSSVDEMNGIAEKTRRLLVLVLLCSIAVSIGIWSRYATVISKRLTGLAARAHADGLKVFALARRITSASKQHMAGIEDQCVVLQNTSAQIQRVAKDIETRTSAAVTDSTACQQHAEGTKARLGEMRGSMESLNAANAKISGLMKTVDEIAFQSRILALNARIEAARAGEAGVSFAVVAEQFGTLAGRCAEAAASTTDFLTDSSKSTVAGMESLRALDAAITQMGRSANQIHSSLDQLQGTATDTVSASKEIEAALYRMRQVVGANQAEVERNAHGAQQMNQLAKSLNGATTELTEMVEGKSKAQAGPQLVRSAGKARQSRAERSAGAKAQANNRSARRAC